MGIYLRKSISVGPFRFTASKSGINVSAGIKGLRLGSGPRGNYIHMGAGGIYYRASLPKSKHSKANYSNLTETLDVIPEIPSSTHGPLEEIDSADVSQIVDSSSKELVDELNQKRKKIRFWPGVAAFSILFLYSAASSAWSEYALWGVAIAGLVGTYLVYTKDVLAKTSVLIYDFDPEMERSYGVLHSTAERLARCSGTWHISASGKVHDRKYHAGANNLVSRKVTKIQKAEPPFLKTNVETISVGVGRQTLHFFPDRVLVYDANGVGAVNYNELIISVSDTRFIEDEGVPSDARVVDRTWRYVNKSGGPDKRFKDNREIPICLYESISITSYSGLNELIQISQTGHGEDFQRAVNNLAKIIPIELP
jgi:hypothetical protein